MRRSAHVVTLCVGLMLSACGHSKPVQSVILQGPPSSVKIDKLATEPVLVVRARLVGDQLWLSAHRSTAVALTKQVKRSSYVIEGRGNPLWEPVEFLLGLAPMLLPTAVLLAKTPEQKGPESTVRYNINPFFAFVHPRYTLIDTTYSGRVSLEDDFPEAPRMTRYRVALPASSQALGIRVLDLGGAALFEGSLEVDSLGEVLVEASSSWERAVAVEVEHRGERWLVGIER